MRRTRSGRAKGGKGRRKPAVEACRISRVREAKPLDGAREPRPVSTPPSFVDSTAVIDAGAEVGDGTRVWHFSHVMTGARIGRGCNLGQNVFVGANVVIGDRVKIQNNVSIYEGVVLEDDVFCGPSAVFTNVNYPRSHISRKAELGSTVVRRGATIGANATVVCGHTIGRYALVGAGAVVTRDIPDHALAVGVPARIVGWVCQCGLRLTFESARTRCGACGSEYARDGTRAVTAMRAAP